MYFNLKILKNDKLKTAKPLLLRTAAFLLIFIIYSGTIGPRIISGGILYTDHFGFYGGLGKALLFAFVAFGILIYRKKILKLKDWKWINLIWLILSFICFLVLWALVSRLLEGNKHLDIIIYSQCLLWLSLAFAALGCFGLNNVIHLAKTYKRELLYSVLLAMLFYGLLAFVYSLWRFLATIVLHSVKWLLNISGLSARILPPRTLILEKFGINIAQYCSGIESLALFSGLYILIGILDWDKFNHRKFLLALPLALIILFGLNVLRVYLLILAGYYINPQIAFSLFHTYAGMVFFIIYSGIFWGVSYKWILRKN